MLRTGRFKHKIIDEKTLAKIASELAKEMQPWVNSYEEHSISAAELCTQVIELYLQKIRPKNWLCPQPRPHFSNIEVSSPLISRVNHSLYRGVPPSVNRSLILWHQGQYPLQLIYHIPSSLEVFALQCEGYRCVTILKKISELKQMTMIGRDPFGFLLHDLIHADHFFRDQILAQGQIGFSRLVKKCIEEKCFSSFENDQLFKKEFEYLISDMNSHPLHLIKTLHAILLAATKRKNGYELRQNLSSKDENLFQKVWRDILSYWQPNGTICTSLEKVNSTNFSYQEDAKKIFDFCLAQGSVLSGKFFAKTKEL